jgi:hypothetical protein
MRLLAISDPHVRASPGRCLRRYCGRREPTVKDLVAGSGLVFEEAGEHGLKSVPDHWRLYRVVK